MKGSTFLKRSLALILTVVMLFSCWVFTAPGASAATAGNYTVVVKFNVADSCGSKYTEDNYITITYKSNNGTGSESTKTWDLDSIVTSGGEKTVSATLGGYPTKVKLNVNNKQASSWKPWDRDTVKVKVHTVTVQNTAVWTGSIELESDVLEHSETKDIGNSPYANSITAISGDSTVYVNTNGTTTNTYSYSLGTVKDQYGVNWYQDASWDTATTSNGVTFSDGTLSVPASSNRASNYTVTLKEKIGSVSNTKTVTVTVFKYQVTFYDEDGKTVLKAKQDVAYNGSATAPSSPTKAYDDSKHYAFNTWTGDTYQNITSGKQVKTVKASYTGTTHTYNQTNVHVDSGTGKTLKTAATCTAAAVYYNTCTCGKVGSTNTHSYGNALGHNWTKQTVNASTKYQDATCEEAAKYWYSCSRCDAIEKNNNHTFTNGSALGHNWGDWVDNDDATEEPGSGTHTATCYTDSTHTKSETHKYGAWQIIPANDTENTHDSHDRASVHFRVCNSGGKGCGRIEYAAHNWVAQTPVPPTCTERGYTPYICSDCGQETTNIKAGDDLPALGHDWGNWTEISSTQHQRVCNRVASHVETDVHTMSAWQNVVPDGDDHASVTARNAVNAAITAGTYNASEQHFKYCTVCGRVEFGTHQYDDGEITTPATCTESGITTYTCTDCGSSYNNTNVEPLGHDWGDVQSHDADDNTTGYTYFQCSRCDLYCSTKYENNATVPDESKPADSLEDENITNNAAAKIASPIFNDGDSAGGTPWFHNRDYISRPAALRIEKPGVETQALRFCANVKVPKGVAPALESDTDDNYIVDFGFVYTQDNVIGGDYLQYPRKEGDPSMMVIYKTLEEQKAHQIYYNSIVDSRLNKTMSDGTTVMTKSNFEHWEGKTIWPRDDDWYITFNLVINVRDKKDENGVSNWTKEYACRPYITYKYHGVTQTVYDEGVSAGTTASSSQKYSHNSVEYIAECIMGESAYEKTPGQLALLKRDKTYCMREDRDLCKYLIMDAWSSATGQEGEDFYKASPEVQKDFLRNNQNLNYILAEDLELEE